MGSSISIKQLHQKTGEQVRRAAHASDAITITDRGKPIAILAKPALLASRPRRRTLLAEYEELLAREPSGNVLDDLDSVRGDR
jgi:antitoxin (DNA-binding transcriptional repressor) of toxin-antitoxin stability system